MGKCLSGLTSKQKQQIIEQNYSNSIMVMALSSLQSISRMILGKNITHDKKRYGEYDTIDYSHKSMAELLTQLNTHLLLFKISKQRMDKDHRQLNGFVFPKCLPKTVVLQEITNYKTICTSANYKQLLDACDDFIKIIDGDYTNLHCQHSNKLLSYRQEEKSKHRRNLLKDGIKASELMNEIKEQVQAKVTQNPIKDVIKNPQTLSIKTNATDVQYQAQANKLIKQIQ